MSPSLGGCLYGPFPSRRLGWSLGVDMLPCNKTCTFDCVYCEIGRTQPEYLVAPTYRVRVPPPPGFSQDLVMIFSRPFHIDSVTFGYNGEPTLNECILDYQQQVLESITKAPIQGPPPILTVFTNSSTLGSPRIRERLAQFDRVLAKLDTGLDKTYRDTNRPHPACCSLKRTIHDLADFRGELDEAHQLVLQCLIHDSLTPDENTNCTAENIAALAQAIQRIHPHQVQLYSVARMPAEFQVIPLTSQRQHHILHDLTNQVDDVTIPITSF